MAYDKNLDKEIFSESAEFEATKLTISVYTYNEGVPKLQISRQNLDTDSGEFKWGKLGRMQKEEVEAILPIIKKAVEKM